MDGIGAMNLITYEEAGISKILVRNKLSFAWGWAEAQSLSHVVQGGLTWALLSAPIMCISSDGQRFEGGELSSDQ